MNLKKILSPKKTKPKNSDLEKIQKDTKTIIKKLEAIDFEEFMVYLQSPWRIIFLNFLAGIFRGLGILIGMTVIVALLVWVLSKFVNFPVVGEYFQSMLELIESYKPPE